jgi:hypothetical protein
VANPRLLIKLDLDQRELTLAGTNLPLHLGALAEQLPAVLAPLTTWLLDETLRDVGGSVTLRQPPTLILFADIGQDGSDPNGRIAVVRASGMAGFALGLPQSADLGGTPVFGHLLSGLSIGNLKATYLNARWPSGVPLPKDLDWSGISTAPAAPLLSIDLGSASGTTSVPLLKPTTPSPPQPPLAWASARSTAASDAAPAAPPPPSVSDLQWTDVGATIGPLTIARIAFATGDALMLGLDASLQTSVLSVQLTGFVVSIPKGHGSQFNVKLDGLSVDLSTASVTLAGSLVHTDIVGHDGKPGFEYDGSLMLKAGPYAIAAVGSYAEVDGVDSLFVYGVGAGTFGGPPAFVVTAIAAGFGVNRDLVLPAPDQVLQFPLVAAAVAAAGTTQSSASGTQAAQQALAQLNTSGCVPIKHGAYWLAIGVAFRSFELVNGFALLTVSFGDELAVGLLGVGALQLPTPVDSQETYAYAELTLDAVLRPAQGTFSLIALLTDRSYVFDPNCKLTGGFATCVWFPPNVRAGDFVVTLGGYNASFYCDWYPDVPRLGFSWKVSDLLSLSGGAYFALTPKCVMAGGQLSLMFQDGPLAAWCNARADFIVYWRPFSYAAGVSVSIGASYTADWGVLHKTFRIELGADVSLWGPPFAGVAHVHWFILSFTIPLGSGTSSNAVTLQSWDQFAAGSLPQANQAAVAGGDVPRAGQLPPQNGNVCRPRITKGLVATITDSTGASLWQLCPDGLVVDIETAIPITSGIDVSVPSSPGNTQQTAPVPFTAVAANVASLGAYPLLSTLTVSLTDPKGNSQDLKTDWTWTPVHGLAPAALWGPGNVPVDPRNPSVPTPADMNVQAVVGVTGTATAATRSAGSLMPSIPPVDIGDKPLPFPAAAAPSPSPPPTIAATTSGMASSAHRNETCDRRAPTLAAVCHREAIARRHGRPPVHRLRLIEVPSLPTHAALPAGSSAIYSTDPARAATVHVDGLCPVLVAVATAGGGSSVVLVPPGAVHVLANAGAWVVATPLSSDALPQCIGWDRDTSRLVQVDEHCFAGDGIVVQTQAPLRRFRRPHRPRRLLPETVDMAWVLAGNLVAGAQGDTEGHITTTFPAGMSALVVVVDGRGEPPTVIVRTGDGALHRHAVPTSARAHDSGDGTSLSYALDIKESCRVMIAAPAGTSVRRVVAHRDANVAAPLDPVQLASSERMLVRVRVA